jgi:S-adenosylmethionine:tRNA ribosyltransferase-isomerase
LKPFKVVVPEQFTYALPDERIASFPLAERDDSLLLVRKKDGSLFKDTFRHMAGYLDEGCHMVFNNSKVIPARLIFTKPTGSRIELFCHKPIEPFDYSLSLSATKSCTWECLVGNLKRFTGNSLRMKAVVKKINFTIQAERIAQTGNVVIIRFSWENDIINFAEILYEIGQVPLPPYIKRNPEELDRLRYQTIYSRYEGSVAAPTAGLHFTEVVFNQLRHRNISCYEITLHIGVGTFQPIKSASFLDHDMHAEYFCVSGNLIQELARLNSMVVAVGTTSVRTLETLYWLGVKLLQANTLRPEEMHLDQWEAYRLPQEISLKQSFEALWQWIKKTNASEIIASTKLMIVPGYKFRVVNTLITNFHQPGSTLLLLVAAFLGDSWKDIYNYALDNGFRFLSYGDSSLLFS